MPIKTLSSNIVRDKWRDVVDSVAMDKDSVVVQRYGKPVAAIIDYALFIELQDALEHMQAQQQGRAATVGSV